MKSLPASSPSIHRIHARRLAVGLSALLLLGVCGASTTQAALQRRIYVASSGNDANTGSLTKPKLTFAGALAALAAGGEIVALDSANYGAATITQPTTITAEPGVAAYVIVGGTNNGITISAGSQDTVTLRGLIFEGGGAPSSGGAGINVTSAGVVRVENCKFTSFTNGISLDSTTSTNLIVDGGNASTVYTGILVMSNASGNTASATVSHFEVDGATTGMYAFAPVTGSVVRLTVNKCVVASNETGLSAAGTGASLFVGDCTISGNFSPVVPAASASTYSFGNNQVSFNNNAAMFTSTLGLQ